MSKISQVFAGVASLALLATAAHAQELTVTASDLDLSTPAGQQALDKRAEGAAMKMCAGTYMARENCVPGVKAKIVARATADRSVTMAKNGKAYMFVQNGAQSLAQK